MTSVTIRDPTRRDEVKVMPSSLQDPRDLMWGEQATPFHSWIDNIGMAALHCMMIDEGSLICDHLPDKKRR
jgi:hypothetical protein